MEATSSGMNTTVLFIDFGNIAKVAKRHLRAMPTEFQDFTALARRVKLANVVPLNGLEWTVEAKKYIEDMLYEHACEITLHSLVVSFQKHQTTLTCVDILNLNLYWSSSPSYF